jgi:hypothetical protein
VSCRNATTYSFIASAAMEVPRSFDAEYRGCAASSDEPDADAFGGTLHNFYTVLSFTCSCTNRCSSMCVDASVAGTRVGWVNPITACTAVS